MRVACSRCRTRYEVPDEKLSQRAVRIRCSRCGNLFLVRRKAGPQSQPADLPEARFEDFETAAGESPEAAPSADSQPEAPASQPQAQAAEPAGEGSLGDLDEIPSLGELDLADFEVPEEAEGGDRSPPDAEEPLEPVREEDLVPPQPAAEVSVQGIADDMPRLDLQRGPRRAEPGPPSRLMARDRRRSPLFWVVVLAVAATGGFTAYNLIRHPEAFTFLRPDRIRALWHRKQVHARLSIQDLEGFYREFPGGRKVFVIRGQIWNRSGATQSLIRIRGNLFDEQGRPLASKEVYCGNLLGERELASLDPKAIDARLMNEVGDGLRNVDIAPGARVPFMVVFIPAPEGVSSYNVEVTESREGASGG